MSSTKDFPNDGKEQLFQRRRGGGASFSGSADFSEGQIFRIEERFFMEVNHFTKYRK
jgi:hypothetical protein